MLVALATSVHSGMPLCAYGSEPIPTAPPYVWATWLDAKSWLGPLWGPLLWVASGAKATLHDTAVFCATEPVQPVTPSAATIVAASHDPIAFEELLTYIEQSATWWVWHNVCQCSGAPGGTCSDLYLPSKTFTGGPVTIGATRWACVQFQANTTVTMYGLRLWLPPAGAGTTSIYLWRTSDNRVVHREDLHTVAGYNSLAFVTPQALTSGQSYKAGYAMGSGGAVYYDVVAPTFPAAGIVTYQAWLHSAFEDPFTDISDAGTGEALSPILCTGGPPAGSPTVPQPPIPPDVTLPDFPLADCSEEDLCSLVQQLRQELTQQRQLVTLIQRQAVPFAWINGRVHAGLTGNGSFSVQGLLGLRVTFTTVPAVWGRSSDNPRRYIPAPGSVAFGYDSGASEDTRFMNLPDEVTLQLGDATPTVVRYHFKPGVTATVTELIREAS